MPSPTTPHLDFPLRFDGGQPVYVEQGSDDDILACVHCIVTTPRGSLPDAPTFGITPPEFAEVHLVDMDRLREEIIEWEPRADLLMSQQPDLMNRIANIAIGVGGPHG
jgi:phage baseplate assembly protein W